MIEAFTIGQNRKYTGTADFFRLIATVGSCDIRFSIAGRIIAERLAVEAGFAEQFKIAPFDEVSITSNAVQNIQFETALGSEIRYDRGASSVTGTVALDAATLAALEQINVRIEVPTNWYKSTTVFAANAPDTVFLPGANTAGAIVYTAFAADAQTSTGDAVYIAKTSAPTTIVDGDIVASQIASGGVGSGCQQIVGMFQSTYIPAGKGLYYIQNGTCSRSVRHSQYKLLP
jgi:hypothetical protein